MTGALVIAALLYYAALLGFREQVMELAYGGYYMPFAAVLIFWGLIPVIMALNAGIGVILRARQLPHLVFIISLVWAIVSLGLGTWLSRVAGIAGASASAVLGYAVAGSVTILFYGRSSRGEETPAQPPGESPE
jgi:O-antigen/teichoic acid export membrane protein